MDLDQIDQDLAAYRDLFLRLRSTIQQLSPQEQAQLSLDPAEREHFTQPLPAAGSKPAVELQMARLLEENRQYKALLEAIYETDPSGIAVVEGPEMRIRYANPVYRYICPHTHTDLIGQTYEAVWSTQGPNSYADQVRAVIKTGRPYMTLDFTRQFYHGAMRCFTFQARRIDWDDHPAALIALWDTTELKKTENALQETNHRVTDILESLTDGFAAWDHDWRFTYVNAAAERLLGRPQAELLGQDVHVIFSNPSLAPFFQRLTQAMIEQTPVTFEECYGPLQTWFEMRAYPSVDGLSVYFSDITQRKKGEKGIQESHQQNAFLASVIELSSQPFGVGYLDGRLGLVNPAFEQLTGYTRDELANADWASTLTPPEWKALEAEKLAELRRTGQPVRYEKEYLRKDGRRVPIELLVHLVKDQDGTPQVYYSFLTDITARKQAEEELRLSRQKTQQILESIQDGFMEIDRDWRFTYVNRRAGENIGYQPEQLVGKNIWEIFPAIRGTAQESLYRQVMDRREPAHLEIEGTLSQKWYDMRAYPSSEGITVFGVDISERKQAEVLAAQNAAKLEAALSSMTDAVFISDAQGQFIHFNEGFASFHRFANKADCARTFAEYPDILDVYFPDGSLAPTDMWAVPRALRGEIATNAEYGLRRKDTGERWVGSYSFGPIRDQAGEIVGSVVVGRDITDRKRAEEQLAMEKERFRTTLTSIGDAVITTDAQSRVTFLNPVAEELTGWSSAEAAGQPMEVVFQIINEQTHLPVENPVAKVFQTGKIIGLANHTALVSRDGRVTPIEDSAAPIRAANGTMTGAVMVFHEVAEKRKAEQDLRASEERARAQAAEFEALMNVAPAYIWVARDPDCSQMISNRYGYDFLNVSPGANVSMSAPAAEHPRHYRAMQNGHEVPAEQMPIQIAARTGVAQHNWQFDVVFDEGDSYALFGNATPILDDQGRPTGAVGVFIDITALKQVEAKTNQLLTENELKERLIEQREQERLQIARDLHDGPVQELTALTFALQGLLMEIKPPEAARALEDIRNTLQRQIQELRDYASALRPPALANFGLGQAIRSHIDTLQAKYPAVALQFEEHQDGELLPEEKRLPLYRIYQESLTNILKHAQAAQVQIRLSKKHNQAVLEIRDNGVGFEVPEDWLEFARNAHLGIVGMRERAEAVGGKLEVYSRPGQGTQIRVKVPLPQPEDSTKM